LITRAEKVTKSHAKQSGCVYGAREIDPGLTTFVEFNTLGVTWSITTRKLDEVKPHGRSFFGERNPFPNPFFRLVLFIFYE
jgi:hypothetical protein